MHIIIFYDILYRNPKAILLEIDIYNERAFLLFSHDIKDSTSNIKSKTYTRIIS